MKCFASLLLGLVTTILSACQLGSQTSHPIPTTDSGYVADTVSSANIPVYSDFDPATDFEPSPSGAEVLRISSLETEGFWAKAAAAYRNLATESLQPVRSEYYIRAALMLYYGGRFDDIEPFFNSLMDTDILQQDMQYQQILLAGVFFEAGKMYRSLLSLPDIETVADARFKILALNIQSKGLLAIGKPLDSAELRMQINQYLDADEIEQNHQHIWEALKRISEPALLRALARQQTRLLRGWLELNLIARRSNMLPDKIEPWINQWRQRYSVHPASQGFVPYLLAESKRRYIKPTKITLMLPLSGRLAKVAEAVQHGFLSAYYQDPAQTAVIEVINASSHPATFNRQYQQAIDAGTEFIVGPMSKDLINALLEQQSLPVPTLVLNYGDADQKSPLNLYQFGLRPEDEAEQVADYAVTEGQHYYAITLVPDTDWGNRLQTAFAERFEALGGRVVGAEVYRSKKSDYSVAIKKLLNLTSSEQRHNIIQQVIGAKASFNARRRQDVNMIFIAANARQARLIKPQLKFHHAQDIPVYATSHIASSSSNAERDRDLDGIQFIDIPWMLDGKSRQDYDAIKTLWPDTSGILSRLFALGVDAYQLMPLLRRLMTGPEAPVKRHTGLLSVDKNGRVHRQLLKATYEKGRVRLIEPTAAVRLESGAAR